MKFILLLLFCVPALAEGNDGNFVLRENIDGFSKTIQITEGRMSSEICSNFVIAGTRHFCCQLEFDSVQKNGTGWTARQSEEKSCEATFLPADDGQFEFKVKRSCKSDSSMECGDVSLHEGKYRAFFKPSFECTNTLQTDELFVCRFPELSQLDQKLGEAYKAKKVTKLVAKKLRTDRAACVDKFQSSCHDGKDLGCVKSTDDKTVDCIRQIYQAVLK